MKKRDGAIITAYTGYVCCEPNIFHKYAEEILGRPIFTHEFANGEIWNELKEKCKNDFLNLIMNLED